MGKVGLKSGTPEEFPPGAVLVARTSAEMERLGVSMSRAVRRDGYFELLPEMSSRDFGAAKYVMLPEVTGHEDKFGTAFSTFLNRSDYFRTRKVVERVMPSGQRVVSVATRLPVPGDPVQVFPAAEKKRKYHLAQLITDTYLQQKFDITGKFLTSIVYQAHANAAAAAARLQEHVRKFPGCEASVVTAGAYERSAKWAKESIRMSASKLSPMEKTYDAMVIDKKIVLYGPGPSSSKRWSVWAPIWMAGVAQQVHAMVQVAGSSAVMFACGLELTILQIDIFNGDGFESPSIDVHAGPQDALPEVSSPHTMSLLSSKGREKLVELGAQLLPIVYNGENIATGVSVGRSGVLVNSHVLEGRENGLLVGGQPLVVDKMISRDLWLARVQGEREEVWAFRDPKKGESVCVYYNRQGVPVCSSPITVRACDGVSLSMSVSGSLGSGMSGGAIIALSDMSFLGVYEGAGTNTALGLAFTPENFLELCTYDDVSVASHDTARSGGDGWYEKFKGRGLGKILDSAIDSIEPMYTAVGQHVGASCALGSALYTTCDVESMALRVGADKKAISFEPAECQGLKRTKDPWVSARGDGPQLVRKPSLMERVLVLCKDAEGPYFTQKETQVVHVHMDERSFVIGLPEFANDVQPLPLVGGVVVAVRDGAVLGMYVQRVTTHGFGTGVLCSSLQQCLVAQAVHESAAVSIQRLFPMLHPGAWEPRLAETVLTHASRGAEYVEVSNNMQGLAFVGDAVAKALLGNRLLARGVPTSLWQKEVQEKQSNVAFAAISERLGLAALVRKGIGVSLPAGNKVHASVLEALLGAVFKNETSGVLEEFCESLGIV